MVGLVGKNKVARKDSDWEREREREIEKEIERFSGIDLDLGIQKWLRNR